MKRTLVVLTLSMFWVGVAGIATSPSGPHPQLARPNFAPKAVHASPADPAAAGVHMLSKADVHHRKSDGRGLDFVP